MIQIENVSKSFGDKKAVDNISFTVPNGSIFGFIGPNGAGKTTTIHMISGVLKPDQGEIFNNGFSIVKEPIKSKKQFCLVPDSPDLFLRLTGMEYISFMADIYQIPRDVKNKRIVELAEEFGMSMDLTSQMQSYSHGMRQKTLIIAALVCNPPIWILDEPMTGLDPNAAYLLKEKMKEHAAKGNTVFFSTHVLEVAEKLCDSIAIIESGTIRYQGTLDALKKQYENKELEEIFMEVTAHA